MLKKGQRLRQEQAYRVLIGFSLDGNRLRREPGDIALNSEIPDKDLEALLASDPPVLEAIEMESEAGDGAREE